MRYDMQALKKIGEIEDSLRERLGTIYNCDPDEIPVDFDLNDIYGAPVELRVELLVCFSFLYFLSFLSYLFYYLFYFNYFFKRLKLFKLYQVIYLLLSKRFAYNWKLFLKNQKLLKKRKLEKFKYVSFFCFFLICHKQLLINILSLVF